MGAALLRSRRPDRLKGMKWKGRAMKPSKPQSVKKPRRNPLVLPARQRQAGPHQDRRRNGERTLYAEEMRRSMNQRSHSREDSTDE
jgi:hypothetical protein